MKILHSPYYSKRGGAPKAAAAATLRQVAVLLGRALDDAQAQVDTHVLDSELDPRDSLVDAVAELQALWTKFYHKNHRKSNLWTVNGNCSSSLSITLTP